MIDRAAIEDLKRRTDIAGVIQPLTHIVKRGQSWRGPCPFCGGSKRSERFEVKPRQQAFMCAVCHAGGDVIQFVRLFYGCGFMEAIEHLGGLRELDAPARAKLEQRAASRERDERRIEEKAVARARAIWDEGEPLPATPGMRYFEARGIPFGGGEQAFSLRFHPALDYFHTPGGQAPQVIHKGPALLAAITREGPDGKPEFRGCHCTYLNEACDGKLQLAPRDGEEMPAKKVRGRAGGGAIRLTPPLPGGLLIIGEGIETARTMLLALRASGRDAAAWTGVSLGNMAGGSLGRGTPHPEKPGFYMPSPVPDMERPGLVPPAWASEILLLGDGDSDPAMTRARMDCAAWRFTNMGFATRIAWADQGKDFNDMVRPGGASGAGAAAGDEPDVDVEGGESR